jgi:hypothetical protein
MIERSLFRRRRLWFVGALGTAALGIALPAVAQQRMVLGEEFTATD